VPDAESAMAPDEQVELGRVVSAYGVKGWVKIQPYSVQADVLLKADVWRLEAPVSRQSAGALSRGSSMKVLAARRQGSTIVASLDAVTDRTQAELLKGCTVWVSRALFPPTEPDEYYWVDLIGCELWGERDGAPELIGKVVDVLDNGAHALLRVARVSARDDGGRPIEILVPFVSAHVHGVDLANKRLTSNWPVEF